MEEKTSHKLTYLYALMSVMIFMLHSVAIDEFSNANLLRNFNRLLRIICNAAVPTFFSCQQRYFIAQTKGEYIINFYWGKRRRF